MTLFSTAFRLSTVTAIAIGLGTPATAGLLGGLINDVKNLATEEVRREIRGAGSSGNSDGQGTLTAGTGGAGDSAGTHAPRNGQPQTPHPDAHHLTWDTKFTSTGLADRKLVGHHFRFYCPPAPSKLVPRRMTGTDVYAFHTVVCRAAVHDGRITLSGGNVTVRMEDGNKRLVGSTQNGFVTHSGPSGIRTIRFLN
ncbi:MAG: LCCL domain-containing protein [Pseudomonadota bacterium]